ncbi:hypothetical protein DV736_g2041, partial [Chaetothyriales sp. CBS 134916]
MLPEAALPDPSLAMGMWYAGRATLQWKTGAGGRPECDPIAQDNRAALHRPTHSLTMPPAEPNPSQPQQARQIAVQLPPLQPAITIATSVTTNTSDSMHSDAWSVSSASTPRTEPLSDDSITDLSARPDQPREHRRRASTILVSQNSADVNRLLGQPGATTELVQKACCGGGCCKTQELRPKSASASTTPVTPPDNAAFRSLNIRLGHLSLDSELTDIVDLPAKTPHPPYHVYSAPLYHARELTKPGAEKRTFHFDLDVTDYPAESGDVDFVVGGAIGVCPANDSTVVEHILDRLGVPRYLRGKPVLLRTTHGRWPTIWGEDEARALVTTRRELLTWCVDIQSAPPTKQVLRLLAEYADNADEKRILTFLSSAQGQAAFCDLRTGPYITLSQLLAAFPSSRPPLDHLLSVLNQLMPRFYSLSQDPIVSCQRGAGQCRRLIEIAVTVHESTNFDGSQRSGVGSGFLERLAYQIIKAEAAGKEAKEVDLRVPMFRGLMSNPLAREFVSDGPMLLIGAGVGIAPFRGFVHRRLKSANCANKVWVLQGIRDSLLDELYSGDWGVDEEKVKKVVQSRRGEGRYVQEEVRAQADLVWFIINAVDGRVFVCGSSKGMGEGVERALVDVVCEKAGLNESEAQEFWNEKKNAGQYITETW